MTLRETVAVTSADINGATAYEVTGVTRFLLSLFSPQRQHMFQLMRRKIYSNLNLGSLSFSGF